MEIKIRKQFCGPVFSGHGGYTAGILAHYFKNTVEVTLLKPIPLEKSLLIKKKSNNSVELLDGETLIALAETTQFQLEIPAPPSYLEAVEASKKYIGFDKEYPFPECFGCGRNRRPGNGLRIFPGKLKENNMVAATWIPNEDLQDDSGKIRSEFIWAALDCPGGIACVGDQIHPLLLGKFAAIIKERPKVNQRCVVIGWPIEEEGRKHLAGTALNSEEGKLLAYGKALWIRPRSQ